jgi:hypothetical protein
MSEPNRATRIRKPSRKVRDNNEVLREKEPKMRRVEPAESGSASRKRAVSPARVNPGETLEPQSPISGSPGPAGGGAAEERCDDEVQRLREAFTATQARASELVNKLERANDELDTVKKELSSANEKTLAELQALHDDRKMLQDHNDEQLRELEKYEDEILRLRAEIARLKNYEGKILRLRAEIARLKAADLRRNTHSRLQTSGTGSGKQPMEVHPPSSERRRSVTPDSNGASSSRDPGNGASSSHHRVSKTPPPPCEACGDVHGTGDVCRFDLPPCEACGDVHGTGDVCPLDLPPCEACGDVHGTGDVCPFDLNVETKITDMRDLIRELKREGKSVPVSFENPKLSAATFIVGPLNNRGPDNGRAHTYKIVRREEDNRPHITNRGFMHVHTGMEPTAVNRGDLDPRYRCVECGVAWGNHNGVHLDRLRKYWEKYFPEDFAAEWKDESNEHQGEHPSEPNKEADMDLHGNSNGEHQGESDEDSDMEREDEPDGFSSEDSEQEED